MSSTQPGTGAAGKAPCHKSTDDYGANSQMPAASSICEAPSMPEAAKIAAFSLPDVPVLVVEYSPVQGAVTSQRTQAPLSICISPHPTVLHCRFLI